MILHRDLIYNYIYIFGRTKYTDDDGDDEYWFPQIA